jgi:hypothetical protein
MIVLTDVTAVAKSQTNRARSEVTGVVSGAGQVSRCLKHLRLMRVLPVGQGEALTQLPSACKPGVGCRFSKAVETTGACLRVVPGTNAHTKGVTGVIPSQ